MFWICANFFIQEKLNYGKVYFYSPSYGNFDEKTELLKLLNVEIIDCGFNLYEVEKSCYPEIIFGDFYLCALEDIKKKIYKRK